MAAHGASLKAYFAVFFALMVLTAITVGVAFIDLGPLSDVVALAIALTKATLVVLYFMHVKGSKLMNKLTVVASAFWILIFFGLLMSDYLTRGFLGG